MSSSLQHLRGANFRTMPVRNIWLVRHGERADVVDSKWFNRVQRAYDDPPLAPLGEEQVYSFACEQDRLLQLQAAETGRRLRDVPIGCIYASPYTRTMQTASIINNQRERPVPIRVEPGICEVRSVRCFIVGDFVRCRFSTTIHRASMA